MANRLSFVLLLTALTSGLVVSACGDDDAIDGGEAGEPGVSGSPGEAGSGASGVSGSSVGGQGATGGQDNEAAGAGQAGQAGGGGAGGGGGGGGGGAGGGAGEAGAPVSQAGAGGSPDPGVNYACEATTIVHKLCSAAAPLNCADQPDCSDCVTARAEERDLFTECAACLAEYDRSYQCAIDLFEAGNASGGLECVEGLGADLNATCSPQLLSAFECTDYIFTNPCPAQWPLEEL